MAYRNDLDALVARKTALEEEVRDRTRELDSARQLVDEIEARARLPVLDNIRVAAPCSARWDAMTGDDRARACGDCQKTVYNLSEMTRDEAEALIRDKEGRLCVRYYQRADGTILLKDCAVGVKRRRRRRIVAAGIAGSIAGTVFGYTRPHSRSEEPPVGYFTVGALRPVPSPEARVTMGTMVVPQEPTREIESEPTRQPKSEPTRQPKSEPTRQPKSEPTRQPKSTDPRPVMGRLVIAPNPSANKGNPKVLPAPMSTRYVPLKKPPPPSR